MNDAAELVADLLSSRAGAQTARERAVFEQFGRWYAERDDAAHDVLRLLAAEAPERAQAMDALLTLIVGHGLARPALRKTLITPHDIDDAEQAVLATVGLKIGQFDGRSRFTTWLHQVAANEARMVIRARDRRPADAVEEPPTAPFLARLSTLVANRDVIAQAFAEVPETYRRPLELREVDGLDYVEIAAVLDLPVGTVRSRLSRGRALIVAALGRSHGEPQSSG